MAEASIFARYQIRSNTWLQEILKFHAFSYRLSLESQPKGCLTSLRCTAYLLTNFVLVFCKANSGNSSWKTNFTSDLSCKIIKPRENWQRISSRPPQPQMEELQNRSTPWTQLWGVGSWSYAYRGQVLIKQSQYLRFRRGLLWLLIILVINFFLKFEDIWPDFHLNPKWLKAPLPSPSGVQKCSGPGYKYVFRITIFQISYYFDAILDSTKHICQHLDCKTSPSFARNPNIRVFFIKFWHAVVNWENRARKELHGQTLVFGFLEKGAVLQSNQHLNQDTFVIALLRSFPWIAEKIRSIDFFKLCQYIYIACHEGILKKGSARLRLRAIANQTYHP